MSAVTLALLAAFVNAGTAVLSKSLASRYPARPIIGVLLLMNCLIMLPFAPFVEWISSPQIIILHVVSAFLLVVSSVPVWDMFDAGLASATSTAQALAPIAAALGSAIFLPGSVSGLQVAAAFLVVAGVTYTLRDAFGQLGRRGSIVRIVITAAGVGLLSVATKMLADDGVGVVETYVVRTGLGAAALLILIPPRGVPLAAAPQIDESKGRCQDNDRGKYESVASRRCHEGLQRITLCDIRSFNTRQAWSSSSRGRCRSG